MLLLLWVFSSRDQRNTCHHFGNCWLFPSWIRGSSKARPSQGLKALRLIFLWWCLFVLVQPFGRQHRYIGIFEVILDPFAVGVGTDLLALFVGEDDCWQVTVEGLSVSHHLLPGHHSLNILYAAAMWSIHRLGNPWLAVRNRSGGEEEGEEKEGSYGELHLLSETAQLLSRPELCAVNSLDSDSLERRRKGR